jgi:RNase H-fold protein (predicted Holliday junction resolvase)
MIIEICVKKIGEDIIVGSKINLEQEIENNKEIKKFGYRIKKEEVKRRFEKFMK